MRFQATVLAFAATLAFTGAQDLSQVPQCAIPCFVAALPASKCGSTDIKCQCTTGREPMQQALMACVPTKCSQEEALKIIPAVSGLCAQAGITLSDIPTGTAASTPGPSSPAGNSAAPSPSGAASGRPSGAPAASGTSTSNPAQSTGAASGNAAAIGAVALGLAAAAFGL
jgi:hypothetical protein